MSQGSLLPKCSDSNAGRAETGTLGAFGAKQSGMKGMKGNPHTFETVTLHTEKNPTFSPKNLMPSGKPSDLKNLVIPKGRVWLHPSGLEECGQEAHEGPGEKLCRHSPSCSRKLTVLNSISMT